MSNPWVPDKPSEAYRRRNPQLYPEASPATGKPADAVKVETDLHNQIIEFCRSRGWIYFHGSTAHRTFRVTGEPDFTVLADGGRTFFFECKAKDGKLSPQQQAVIAWAEKLGHRVHVVYSIGQFSDVIEQSKLNITPSPP
jgi:hypothetical protein